MKGRLREKGWVSLRDWEMEKLKGEDSVWVSVYVCVCVREREPADREVGGGV